LKNLDFIIEAIINKGNTIQKVITKILYILTIPIFLKIRSNVPIPKNSHKKPITPQTSKIINKLLYITLKIIKIIFLIVIHTLYC